MSEIYRGSRTSEISDREMRACASARAIAADGIVLLENRENVLPLKHGDTIALYGGSALYTIVGGTGSGSVNNRSDVSIAEGLRNAGIRLATEKWLSDYKTRYEAAKENWIKEIYEQSVPDDFDSLYRAHAMIRLEMPKGAPIEKTDTETAVYCISRVSGEGADRKAVKGDYELSETEEEELAAVTANYRNVIVILNVGGVMDTSFVKKFGIKALVLLSQAGMEGGNALADVLTGAVCPSGRLTDTWAAAYRDYPSSATFSHNNGNIHEEKYTEGIYVGYRYFDSFGVKPAYPFGYGLSYTTFILKNGGAKAEAGKLTLSVSVTNTGACAGREVVQVYASCPQNARGKELKRLIGFGKTETLEPGGYEILHIECSLRMLESYHGGTSSWELDEGIYYIFAGTSAAELLPAAKISLSERKTVETVRPICPLNDALKEICPQQAYIAAEREKMEILFRETPELPLIELDDAVVLCAEKQNKDRNEGADLRRQKAIRCVAQLTVEEKARLCCGRTTGGVSEIIGSQSVTVPGAAGETETVLTEKFGIGNLVLADGPAGLRLLQHYQVDPKTGEVLGMSRYQALENRFFGTEFLKDGMEDYYQFCSAIPVGTLLAQTFDTKRMEEAGRLVGTEMQEFHVDLWLAPGMNIHRNPLCGRNFEYYSEDPLVSGLMAAAITKGVQSFPGLGTTIKHFACNNQEENRRGVSSIISERALREIYLKGFEIAVKTAQPLAIMTSYNKINGVHSANNDDLCMEAARREWGFEGIIMTDWTTTNADGGASAARCMEAGNDLVMPGRRSDIREICDAVSGVGEQYLDEEKLNACAIRITELLLRCGK